MGHPEQISSSIIAKASKFEQVLLTCVLLGCLVPAPDLWISGDDDSVVEL
jgi:hypothetical protein